MTAEIENLLDVLLQLSQEDRAALAAVLTDSLRQGTCAEIEASWIEEANRRLERVRSGQSTLIASELVEQELDELVVRARSAGQATG